MNCHLSLRLEHDSGVDHGFSRWLSGQQCCWLKDDPNTGQWLKVKRKIWNEFSVFPLLGELPTKGRLSWSWKGPSLPETSRYSAWNTDGRPHVACTRCKDYKSRELLSKIQANPQDERVFQSVLRSSVHQDLRRNVWIVLGKPFSLLSSHQASSMSLAPEVSEALRRRPACMFKPPSFFSLRVPLKPPQDLGMGCPQQECILQFQKQPRSGSRLNQKNLNKEFRGPGCNWDGPGQAPGRQVYCVDRQLTLVIENRTYVKKFDIHKNPLALI